MASLREQLLPPLTLLGSVLASAWVFVSASTYTLDAVASLAAATEVNASIRSSYVSELTVAKAAELDAARATPVVVDMTDDNPASAPQKHSHTVTVESLRVRAGPGKTAPQVAAVKGGTKVNVIAEKSGWLQIVTPNGDTGWVYHKFLNRAAYGPQDVHPLSETGG